MTTVTDTMIDEAKRLALRDGWLSVALLQRNMRCSYTTGSQIIDRLVAEGFLGGQIPYRKGGCDLSPRRAVNW